MLVTYIEAIRQAMDEEMERDGNVLLMGEDVGVLGGAFKASAGLQEKHGADRVVDMPISESLIVGAGVGLAVRGCARSSRCSSSTSSPAASTRS